MVHCTFEIILVGVRFPCDLEFGHKGKCQHSLLSVDADITWFPSDEDRVREMGKIVEEARRRPL